MMRTLIIEFGGGDAPIYEWALSKTVENGPRIICFYSLKNESLCGFTVAV